LNHFTVSCENNQLVISTYQIQNKLGLFVVIKM